MNAGRRRTTASLLTALLAGVAAHGEPRRPAPGRQADGPDAQ